MRATNLYAPTLRETPKEAEVISHQLMLRAGMIKKSAAGMYSYLPLAWRTMKKIMNIIREEMDAAGGQELLMPIALPAEIWQQSGRWEVYGAELWRVKDRHGRDFCLGPTHEEIFTTHAKSDIRSYKQLPQRLYQIQTKFRDERRPRFGLMRSREFVMKDLYSFDRDQEGLDESYRLMHQAYTNVFSRCGLKFRPVQADSGAIGGKGSHEFMALADSGEAEILYCDACDYAASSEIAAVEPQAGSSEEMKEVEKLYTPDCSTIADLGNFLNTDTKHMVKAMCYDADGELILVLIRGDRRINEIKLKNVLNCLELVFATDEAMERAGLVPGFIGPMGLNGVRIIADKEVPLLKNHLCGANEKNYHLHNVNYQRDYNIDIIDDIRMVEEGEACPVCGAPLKVARGIEVGQIFKLQTKYSKAFEATYVDENGEEHDIVMGCYGIGVGRTMAAVIEQSYDDKGIIWPMSIAPYQVVIVPVNDKDEELIAMSEKIYADLLEQKVEVVLDDRKERPGVKFNDSDLIGYPIRITIGKKVKESGNVEIKVRSTGEVTEIPIAEAVSYVKELIDKA